MLLPGRTLLSVASECIMRPQLTYWAKRKIVRLGADADEWNEQGIAALSKCKASTTNYTSCLNNADPRAEKCFESLDEQGLGFEILGAAHK